MIVVQSLLDGRPVVRSSRFVVVLSLVLCWGRRGHACQCSSEQGRLLVPLRNTAPPGFGPFLIGHSLPATPILFDPDGQRVDLVATRRAGGNDSCAMTYELFELTTFQREGEYDLLVTNDTFTDAPYRIDLKPGTIEVEDLPIAVSATRENVEAYQYPGGFCGHPIVGATVIGEVHGEVAVPEQVPAFIEVTVEDPTFTIRSVRSNLDTGIVPLPETLPYSVPLTSDGTGCVSIRVFDWRLLPVWSTRTCPKAGESVTQQGRGRFTRAGLPEKVNRNAPVYDASDGCEVAPSGAARPPWVAALLLLIASGARRLRRRR